MPDKRIILMYISEISGHHSATLAIEKAIKATSPQAQTLNINAFRYTNPISEKIVNRLYMGVIQKTPRLWDYLYDNPKVVKRLEKIKQKINKFNSPKLKNLFDDFKPDAVVCTQAFPCGMVADYKKAYQSNLALFAVLTDYVPHSYWIYDNIDYYITPSDEVAARLIKKGVARQKIKELGIPFDHRFNQPVDKDKVCGKLKLCPNVPLLLIMGGGHGLGPIKEIMDSLDKMKEAVQEIVVTGSNKKLYSFLSRRLKRYKQKILVLGYADNINELMGISDMIITKPGGVTTAEALAKSIPMVIVKPIPGQEANNAAYLTKEGAAIKVDDPKKINLAVEELLLNRDRLVALRHSCQRISKPNASLDIARFILNV